MKACFRAKTIDEQIEALSPTPEGRLPSASINARLIRDLSLVYNHPSYAQHLEHSLAQVEQRLKARQIQQGNVAASAQQRAQSSLLASLPPARKREQPRRTPSAPHRFATALGSMAAVLFAALLVGSFILLLTHAHQTGSGRVKPENTPATGKQVGPLTYIHMFDATTGWAVNNNTNRILHTTAGVTHWQDVTPAVAGRSSIIAGTAFFNPSTAWVAVIEGSRLFVYRTHDGGQTWQKASIPDRIGSSYHMTFLNARVGWLLVGNVVAMDQEAVDVLQTRDGGVSWKVISAFNYNLYFNNPAGFQNPTGLSVEGHKTGVSFVNETTGWATASTAAGRIAWLYITHDGGVSWQQQSIPEPPDAFQEWETLPPVFFNATDGILPHIFLFSSASQTLNLYFTHNGGASWSATPAVSPSATAGTLTTIPDGAIDFVDARHGWFASNTFNVKSYQYLNSTVYRTSDGGQRWTHYTIRLNADITMIDFVSQTQGWAIDSAQALYQTTDGGQTWTKVRPTVA